MQVEQIFKQTTTKHQTPPPPQHPPSRLGRPPSRRFPQQPPPKPQSHTIFHFQVQKHNSPTSSPDKISTINTCIVRSTSKNQVKFTVIKAKLTTSKSHAMRKIS